MTWRWSAAAAAAGCTTRSPNGYWKVLTILGALSTQGMLAATMVEAATDREVFLAFLEQVLCPKLRPGDTVLWTRLSARKVAGVRELIDRAASWLLSLPRYSRGLNPNEKAWSKLKTLLRQAKARSPDALHRFIAQLLPAIGPKDAQARFRPLSAAQL